MFPRGHKLGACQTPFYQALQNLVLSNPVLAKTRTAVTLAHLNVEDGDLLRLVDGVPDAQVVLVLRHDDVTLGDPLNVAAKGQQRRALLQATRGERLLVSERGSEKPRASCLHACTLCGHQST